MSREISALSDTIRAIEEEMGAEDVSFLQVRMIQSALQTVQGMKMINSVLQNFFEKGNKITFNTARVKYSSTNLVERLRLTCIRAMKSAKDPKQIGRAHV